MAFFFRIDIQCRLDINLLTTRVNDKVNLILRLLLLPVYDTGYFDDTNIDIVAPADELGFLNFIWAFLSSAISIKHSLLTPSFNR